MTQDERNEAVRRVAAGDKIWDIADDYGVTSKWIYRLATKAGIAVPEHPPVLTGRDQYLGVNVTVPVKEEIVRRAKTTGKSQSQITDEGLAEVFGVGEKAS